MISAPALAPGTLLHNRYRIVGVAGQEQSGRTYLARDQRRAETLCILKEFALPTTDPQALEALQKRFQAAAAGLYRLQHPQLPRYQVMIVEADRGYWVREYIEGKDYRTLLQERVAAGKAFSETDVLQLLEQVIPVLDYLHQEGMIHRNVSLENLVRRDRDHLPVLINYGLVKELVAQLQTAQAVPLNFKPSKADPSFDRAALANLAVTLLAGLEEKSRAQIAKQIAADPAFTQLLQPKYFQQAAQLQPSEAAPVASSRRSTSRARRSTQSPTPQPVPPRSSQKGDAVSSAALVISLILLVAAAAFRVAGPARPSLEPPPTATSPLPAAPLSEKPVPPGPTSPLPVPVPPPPPQGVGGDDEPAKLQSFHAAAPESLRDRRRQLGVDFPFFTRLVDEAFYAKYPELKRRKLGEGAEQEKYRSEWNAIALTLMDKLQQITPEMRGKLGTYQRSNYDQWLKTVGAANQRKLADLTDRRFLELFPDQQGKPQNPQTYGQIWYAIAHEQSQRKELQP